MMFNGVLRSGEGNVVYISYSKRDLRKMTRSFNKAVTSFFELDINENQIETFRKKFIDLTMFYTKLVN